MSFHPALASTLVTGQAARLDIHGRPMIVLRARPRAGGGYRSGCRRLAAILGRSLTLVRAHGGIAVLTDPTLPGRGSDRVHAALAELDPQGRHDVVVNLQGDLPSIPPVYLRTVLTPLSDPGFDIATLVAPIESGRGGEPAVGGEGGLCIRPRARGVSGGAVFLPGGAHPVGARGLRWHHIGIYAFRRSALAHFVSLPEAPLESRESLEQLRALEAGMRIACARVESAPYGVDTPDDLERARRDLAPKGTAA